MFCKASFVFSSAIWIDSFFAFVFSFIESHTFLSVLSIDPSIIHATSSLYSRKFFVAVWYAFIASAAASQSFCSISARLLGWVSGTDTWLAGTFASPPTKKMYRQSKQKQLFFQQTQNYYLVLSNIVTTILIYQSASITAYFYFLILLNNTRLHCSLSHR